MSTKPTPCPRTVEKSTWQKREASKLCFKREGLVEQQIYQDRRNWKLKAKFFDPFQILHLVRKQAYKLDFPTKWKIYDIFYVTLLEQFPELEPEFDVDNNKFNVGNNKFDAGNNKKYKVEAIIDSAVYFKEAERHLPGLYYLVSWKGYPKEEST